jgi:hypothetical protein
MVHIQGVSGSMLVTLGRKQRLATLVVNCMNSVGVQFFLAVDDRPVGNDIIHFQIRGILDRG